MRARLGAVALGLGLSLAACGGGSDAPAATGEPTPSASATAPGPTEDPSLTEEAPKTVRIGEPFRQDFTNDGQALSAEVTVTKLACGIPSITVKVASDETATHKPPAGETFCRAWFTVKNVGRRPMNWGSNNDSIQLMTSAGYILTNGAAYDASDDLTQEGNTKRPDPRYAGSELNPRAVGYTTQVWSMPADAKAEGLEIRAYDAPPVLVKI